jgi:hypothetical protein
MMTEKKCDKAGLSYYRDCNKSWRKIQMNGNDFQEMRKYKARLTSDLIYS